MSEHEKLVQSFRRRIGAVLLLKHTLILLAAWTFLWGGVVLVARGALGMEREPLLWGLMVPPLALVPAFFLARARIPAADSIRALIDGHNRFGGVLMAGAQAGLGEWERKIRDPKLPSIHWHCRKTLIMLGLGLAFVLTAFLLPQRLTASAEPPLEVDRDIDRLTRQIEALAREKVLDPARAEELTRKLEEIRKKASGRDPGRTLEALDHVGEVVKKNAREAAEKAEGRAEKAGQAESLARAAQQALQSGQIDSRKMAETAGELGKLLGGLADDPAFRKLMEGAMKQALDNGKLDPKLLAAAAEMLKNHRGALEKMAENLYKSGALDQKALEAVQKAGKFDSETLARLLQQKNGGSIRDMLRLARGNGDGGGQGGKGGDSRLTFGERTKEDGFKFKEVILPRDQSGKPVVGGSAGGGNDQNPMTGTTPREKPQGGALEGAKSGGGSASTQVILPRHRGPVQRFFERDSPNK